MKRTLKLALGYSVHSLFPIVSWFLWGVLIDQDYVSVFTLTYSFQFIWAMLIDIYGYGAETYASLNKDRKRDIALSGVIYGIFALVIVFSIAEIFSVQYMNLLGYGDIKLLGACRYSLLALCLSGITSLLSIYCNFKEDYTKGSKILVEYNVVTYVSLVVCLFITRNNTASILVSGGLSVTFVTCNIVEIVGRDLKDFKRTKVVKSACKYVLGELAADFGLLFTYVFGISNVVSNNAELVITYSIWLQVMDWIWDAQGGITPTMVRIDASNDKFDYKASAKNLFKLDLIFCVIVGLELVIASVFYKIHWGYLLIFALLDIADLFIHIFNSINNNYLSTMGESKKVMNIQIVGYILRVFVTLIIPTAVGTYIAQLSTGVVKTIWNSVLYKKKRSELSLENA